MNPVYLYTLWQYTWLFNQTNVRCLNDVFGQCSSSSMLMFICFRKRCYHHRQPGKVCFIVFSPLHCHTRSCTLIQSNPIKFKLNSKNYTKNIQTMLNKCGNCHHIGLSWPIALVIICRCYWCILLRSSSSFFLVARNIVQYNGRTINGL